MNFLIRQLLFLHVWIVRSSWGLQEKPDENSWKLTPLTFNWAIATELATDYFATIGSKLAENITENGADPLRFVSPIKNDFCFKNINASELSDTLAQIKTKNHQESMV